jgi:hypothetical protein
MYAAGYTYGADSKRTPQWFLYSDTPFRVAQGLATGVEITRNVTKSTQQSATATISVAWHDEFAGVNQPKVGQILELRLEGVSYWIGVIRTISNYRVQPGVRSMDLQAYTRDAWPAWRETRRATIIYPVGTPLSYIAGQVAACLGLDPSENLLPDTGMTTVQSNVQIADLPAWQMFGTLYQPAGYEPFVDCRGRLKAISRDFGRQSDIVLTDDRRLVKIAGGNSSPAVSEVTISWLDPALSQSTQQQRMLANESLTAGFFQLTQNKTVYFSSDQTQRARDTFLKIRQSANGGLGINFSSESYAQIADNAGQITLTTTVFAPALAGAALVAQIAAAQVPDIAPPGGGPVVPAGRFPQQVAQCALLLIMMCMGTGVYEVWGTPFDYVHARNKSTVYNSNATVFEIQNQEIENDFVMNEAGAQAFAVRELAYAYRSASSFNPTIVDDTHIEPGDIVELSDGSRVYVVDYRRDVSSGAPAVLDITGFLVP